MFVDLSTYFEFFLMNFMTSNQIDFVLTDSENV